MDIGGGSTELIIGEGADPTRLTVCTWVVS